MHDMPSELNRLTEAVIVAAIEVHRQLGPAFIESTTHRALEIELEIRDVALISEYPIKLDYKGRPIGERRVDLLVGNVLVVELKAVESIAPIHHAQVISYLKATGYQAGLLINFNVELLRDGVMRIVLSNTLPSSTTSAPPRLRKHPLE